MAEQRNLRPLERRILRLVEQGLDPREIGRRFRRSPEFVERVVDLTRVPRRTAASVVTRAGESLRPIERRVLDLRSQGVSFDELARRFRRGPRHLEQVERLAKLRQPDA